MITLTDVSMVLSAAGRSVKILDAISLSIPAKQTVAIVMCRNFWLANQGFIT
jgi:putative ABC transport system ATP-binding protein